MNTYAEINLDAIKHNVVELKKLLPRNTRFMAVVKANAYGHGSVAVSRAAIDAGADYLAVANLKEALELREAGILVPILILTESLASVADDIIQNDLTQTIYSYKAAKALSDEAEKKKHPVKVHIKIDTGMGRVGILPSEAQAMIKKISSLKNIQVEGVFTHFARAEDKKDAFTLEQFKKFSSIISKVSGIAIRHAANSAATLNFPETHLDMVRVGLMIYGLYPGNGEIYRKVDLRPALSFKTRVAYLKKVPAKTPLSYGGTHITRAATTIATLPVGYADGFSRRLSNKASVLINGKRFPVVGNVSMDITLVDVGNEPVLVGDEVVLIGEQKNQVISADEIARLQDTINYEVICGIGKRVPRIYR